ncbi:hypothetical protein HPB52_025029 [Rhipicephalus sanguineus]|uniref:Uncharacterized protein n=1 Tax=Rhipicephalus sanguineus TaxID=34632 RepID=A0A9D4YRU0_RHISA|nr:hypothetical protein HPB52_025029 [Rhipicephalus sanguineus]
MQRAPPDARACSPVGKRGEPSQAPLQERKACGALGSACVGVAQVFASERPSGPCGLQEDATTSGGVDVDFPTGQRGPGRLRVDPRWASSERCGWDWTLSPSRVLSAVAPLPTKSTPPDALLCPPTLRPSTLTLAGPRSTRGCAPPFTGAPGKDRDYLDDAAQLKTAAFLPWSAPPARGALRSIQAVVAALASDPTFTAAIASASWGPSAAPARRSRALVHRDPQPRRLGGLSVFHGPKFFGVKLR